MQKVIFSDLGVIDYQQAWDLQESLFNETVLIKTNNRNIPEAEQQPTRSYLLFCEHPHVYTLGKSGKQEHLLLDDDALLQAGATFYKINRGGDITYHGPGQIVGYPIFDLDCFFTDIHKYLRYLEEAVIITLEHYHIKAGRIEGLTGVWIDRDDPVRARKICAMGVRCSRWVTMHGFAFNVNADLSYFGNIVPCGITDKAVTSLHSELGCLPDMEEVKRILLHNLCNLFNIELVKQPVAMFRAKTNTHG